MQPFELSNIAISCFEDQALTLSRNYLLSHILQVNDDLKKVTKIFDATTTRTNTNG